MNEKITKITIREGDQESVQDMTHGILVLIPGSSPSIDDVQIAHFIGYSSEPSEIDFNELRQELDTNTDLGCVNLPYELVAAPKEVIELNRRILAASLTNDVTNI